MSTNGPGPSAAADVNRVSGYLAQRDFSALTRAAVSAALGRPADLLILMGGSIAAGCEAAARAYRSGVAERFMIVGGAGHTTQALRDAVHARYPDVETRGRAEADLIADMFERHYGLRRSEMILENQSANCGENAVNALAAARERGLRPETVILMQDSAMQRRMHFSFEKAWRGEGARFYGYAAHVPRVAAREGVLAFEGEIPWGMWDVERFLTLILGEIPRLHDTPEGYGPRGKGFIAHCDVPDDVLEAFSRLARAFPDRVRPAWRAPSP